MGFNYKWYATTVSLVSCTYNTSDAERDDNLEIAFHQVMTGRLEFGRSAAHFVHPVLDVMLQQLVIQLGLHEYDNGLAHFAEVLNSHRSCRNARLTVHHLSTFKLSLFSKGKL